MLHRYSVAIHPTPELIAKIKGMKEQLANEIGWFHSKNAIAHITICEFEADEKDIERVKKQLIRICDSITPVSVHLNGFGNFSNGAFYINPDETSKANLAPIMRLFHNALVVKTNHHSDLPHISIARKLSIENLAKANQVFTLFEETFLCDGIVLRLLDLEIKQFRVINSFQFKGIAPLEVQGTLF